MQTPLLTLALLGFAAFALSDDDPVPKVPDRPQHAQAGGPPVEVGQPERLLRVSTRILITRAKAIDPDPEVEYFMFFPRGYELENPCKVPR